MENSPYTADEAHMIPDDEHHTLPDKLLSMREAMEYLTEKGFPCRSRATFYKMLENFDIPYTVTNPAGKNKVRRFPLSGLEHFVQSHGVDV